MSPGQSPAASRTVFTQWPPALARLFDGDLDGARGADKLALTVSLVTLDAEGRPRTALLGAGEVLVRVSQRIELAVWAGSRAALNLAAGRPAALSFVDAGAFIQVQLGDVLVRPAQADWPALSFLSCALLSGETQAVAYARLVAGITFELTPPTDATLARWRGQLAALLVA